MADWTIPEMIEYVEKKKTSLLLRHGVIAVYAGTKRIVTKEGKRSIKRKRTGPRRVGKQGFMDSWNIITNQFNTYGFFMTVKNPILTGTGKKQNRLHMRDPDSKRRDILFHHTYQSLFKAEIKQFNDNQ